MHRTFAPFQLPTEATPLSSEDGYPILAKALLAPETWSFVVHAPLVARGRKPGQFLMVAPEKGSERIPLTLAGGDAEAGWIRFVMMEAGATTRALARLEVGDRLYTVAGPMGTPTELPEAGTVVLVAGGYGAGAVLTAAEVLHARGQRVITILGGRSRERVLLTRELAAVSSELILTTDDGSLGRQGRVTDALKDVLAREAVAQVLAVGPMPMMEAVAELTRPQAIPTLVSLNALMVDGTGMCGGCRVTVGGQTRFACFDGPDFDGHQVDFAGLKLRQDWYHAHEREAEAPHRCRIGRGIPEETEATASVETLDLPEAPGSLSAAERRALPRQAMPCQDAAVRIGNFQEVALGLSPEQAQVEALRCIQCRRPACVEGCPVAVDIPGFLAEVAQGRPAEAGAILARTSSLPAVCGRVCPQEKQCEARCVLGVKGEPVAIGAVERFAADALRAAGSADAARPAPTGHTVAVVGAGPAGLSAAGTLARLGHAVTVFEALSEPGGVLRYGIPEFRLPNAIVDGEVEGLKAQGVTFVLNTLIGRSLTLEELQAQYDAVFLGSGAGLPRMLGIPGEHLKGVYTANEFLTRVNLMEAHRFPESGTPVTVGRHVVVVGCGNTAMDAARCARRMGAEVTVVYRRTAAESTARAEELEHAMEEGIAFRWLTNPVAMEGDEAGWLKTATCARMALTEPGTDGRRGVQDSGEREAVPCDTLIVALGCAVNPLIPQMSEGLETKRGVLQIEEATGATQRPGVYAGGDLVTGGATVILAMGQGRRAAEAIHARLQG